MNLVFLGAGASKPFDIPTMQEMVDQFEKELRLKANRSQNFYLDIKRKLSSAYGDRIDIESMLSVINKITENAKPFNSDYFTSYCLESRGIKLRQFSDDEIKIAKELKQLLMEYIHNVCSKQTDDFQETYDKSYLPLFKYMERNEENLDSSCTEARKTVPPDLAVDWKAYTTNYDNVFENFWAQYAHLEDHFKQPTAGRHFFTTKNLSNNFTFVKLHGSLNWTKEIQSRQIVRIQIPGSYSTTDTGDTIMLYPISQKDLYLQPWFTLFGDLKSGLETKKRFYVIGYAFNDEYVRNAFEEALHKGKTLLIIDPNALQIREKFSKSARKKINILPVKFGDPLFERQFADHSTNSKTILIRFHTHHHKSSQCTLGVKNNDIIYNAEILNGDKVSGIDAGKKTDSFRLFRMNNRNKAIIKVKIKIKYHYGDKIKLEISDGTVRPNFTIEYNPNYDLDSGCNIIARGLAATKRSDSRFWTDPITLDERQLFPDAVNA